MSIRNGLAAMAVMAGLCGSADAAVVFGDFEDGTTNGFASLTNSGVGPWASPVSGQVVTGSVGSTTGSKVLELSGNAAFDFGQSTGAALGFDFLSAGLRAAFFANDRIEFDWVAPPNGSAAGFSQLFNIVLNSQGGNFQNVAGSNLSTPETGQGYFTGYTGTVHHVVVDYTAYKNAVLASANPDGGGWLQFGIQPNAGGGAPGVMQFDNFQFTSSAPAPEPATLTALAALAVPALLARRRRRRAA